MAKFKTVLSVRNYNAKNEFQGKSQYEVTGDIQEAVKKLRSQVGKLSPINIVGFKIDGELKEADLASYWQTSNK